MSGNWQIQAGITAPNAGVFLAGDLQNQGSAASGTMLLSDLTLPNSCSAVVQPLSFTGTASFDRGLVLTSAPAAGSVVSVSLEIPSATYAIVTGTVAISGPVCNYSASSAVAAQIESVSGAFTGTLSSANLLQPPTVSLALTQAATAVNGQFPLTGTLQLTGPYCNVNYGLSGAIGGIHLSLVSPPDPVTGVSSASVSAYTNNVSSQLSNVAVTFAAGPCLSNLPSYDIYTGTLTKQ
jgi:hypothetical protein